MSFSSDEVNYLIYRYLKESGFQHTAFTFGYESNIVRADINPAEVSHGALINIVQKGLLYLEIERDVKEGPKDDNEPKVLVKSLHKALVNSGAVTTANSNSGAAPTRTKKEPSLSSSTGSSGASKVTPAPTPTKSSATVSSAIFQTQPVTPSQPQKPHNSSQLSNSSMEVDVVGLSSPSSLSPTLPPQSNQFAPAKQTSESKVQKKKSATSQSPKPSKKEYGPDRIILQGHTGEVVSCSWNPKQSDLLATCSGDATARLWTLHGMTKSSSSALHHGAKVKPGAIPPSQVTAIEWNPTGLGLATSSFDGIVRIWDAGGSLRTQLNTKLTYHEGAIFSLKWNPLGTRLLSAGADKHVAIWNYQSNLHSTTLLTSYKNLHTDTILDSDWNSAESFATASSDKTIKVCKLPSAEKMSNEPSPSFSLHGHSLPVNSIQWSRSSPNLLASGSDDMSVGLWTIPADETDSVRSLEPTKRLSGHQKEVFVVRWDPLSSNRIASASFDSTVKIWDVENGVVLDTLTDHMEPVVSICFSPSGQYLASGSPDKTIHIWDIKNGSLVKRFSCNGGVIEVAWNASGDRLAACCSDNTVAVFDFP